MFSKKSKKNNTSKTDTGSIIALVFGLAVAFILYYLTGVTLLFPLCVAIALISYYSLIKNKESKEISKELSERISFYRMYLLYSSLESSFGLGFRKAVDSLPICDLKDKLTDFLESEEKVPPLELTKTRSESELISCIVRTLNSEMELSHEELNVLDTVTEKFIAESTSSSQTDFTFLTSAVLLFLYLLTIIASLLSYEA